MADMKKLKSAMETSRLEYEEAVKEQRNKFEREQTEIVKLIHTANKDNQEK